MQSGLRHRRRGMACHLSPWYCLFKDILTLVLSRKKNARRTMSGEVVNHASSSRAPGPDTEAEASTRRTPDVPPTEDADRMSATNSEVESAMNHRRRRAVPRDA